MRVEIRKIIDTTKPINLKELSPIQKVVVAVKTAFNESKFISSSRIKREQSEHRARLQAEDQLKDVLLAKVYQALVANTLTKEQDVSVQKVYIKVDSKYKNYLFDEFDREGRLLNKSILKHLDFAQYNCAIVQENADLRRAFPEMPYLLEFSKKVLK